jgi:short-subunit dehydrogenase
VQAVLPGATATEFWDIAGLPVRNLPTEIVMAAEDTVDAALAGLDREKPSPSHPCPIRRNGIGSTRRAVP